MRSRYVLLALAVVFCAAGASWAAEGDPDAPYKEVKSIGLTSSTKIQKLITIAMDSAGNILAADGGKKLIKIITPQDKSKGEVKLRFAPTALYIAADGSIYVGGVGKLAKLSKKGKLIKSVDSATGNFPNAKVAAIAATKKELFVSFGTGRSLGAKASLVRFGLNFQEAKVIAEGLRGCCQRLDVITRDDVIYVAENARHRVVKYDREGKIIGQWGKRDRKGEEGFGSCCNPMNIGFGPDGEFYTAESGLGRLKRYTADGKYLGLVGFVDVPRFTRAGRFAMSCSNVEFVISKDKKHIFVTDIKKNIIRVLEKKGK